MRDIDENATRQALARIASAGSDLLKPLEMDFFVVALSEATGMAIAVVAEKLGFRTKVESYKNKKGLWTCYCTKVIVPSFETVIAIEHELDELAELYGGYIDGFGTFGNATTKSLH